MDDVLSHSAKEGLQNLLYSQSDKDSIASVEGQDFKQRHDKAIQEEAEDAKEAVFQFCSDNSEQIALILRDKQLSDELAKIPLQDLANKPFIGISKTDPACQKKFFTRLVYIGLNAMCIKMFFDKFRLLGYDIDDILDMSLSRIHTIVFSNVPNGCPDENPQGIPYPDPLDPTTYTIKGSLGTPDEYRQLLVLCMYPIYDKNKKQKIEFIKRDANGNKIKMSNGTWMYEVFSADSPEAKERIAKGYSYKLAYKRWRDTNLLKIHLHYPGKSVQYVDQLHKKEKQTDEFGSDQHEELGTRDRYDLIQSDYGDYDDGVDIIDPESDNPILDIINKTDKTSAQTTRQKIRKTPVDSRNCKESGWEIPYIGNTDEIDPKAIKYVVNREKRTEEWKQLQSMPPEMRGRKMMYDKFWHSKSGTGTGEIRRTTDSTGLLVLSQSVYDAIDSATKESKLSQQEFNYMIKQADAAARVILSPMYNPLFNARNRKKGYKPPPIHITPSDLVQMIRYQILPTTKTIYRYYDYYKKDIHGRPAPEWVTTTSKEAAYSYVDDDGNVRQRNNVIVLRPQSLHSSTGNDGEALDIYGNPLRTSYSDASATIDELINNVVLNGEDTIYDRSGKPTTTHSDLMASGLAKSQCIYLIKYIIGRRFVNFDYRQDGRPLSYLGPSDTDVANSFGFTGNIALNKFRYYSDNISKAFIDALLISKDIHISENLIRHFINSYDQTEDKKHLIKNFNIVSNRIDDYPLLKAIPILKLCEIGLVYIADDEEEATQFNLTHMSPKMGVKTSAYTKNDIKRCMFEEIMQNNVFNIDGYGDKRISWDNFCRFLTNADKDERKLYGDIFREYSKDTDILYAKIKQRADDCLDLKTDNLTDKNFGGMLYDLDVYNWEKSMKCLLECVENAGTTTDKTDKLYGKGKNVERIYRVILIVKSLSDIITKYNIKHNAHVRTLVSIVSEKYTTILRQGKKDNTNDDTLKDTSNQMSIKGSFSFIDVLRSIFVNLCTKDKKQFDVFLKIFRQKLNDVYTDPEISKIIDKLDYGMFMQNYIPAQNVQHSPGIKPLKKLPDNPTEEQIKQHNEQKNAILNDPNLKPQPGDSRTKRLIKQRIRIALLNGYEYQFYTPTSTREEIAIRKSLTTDWNS